jgi:hypothetical protein
LELIFTSPLIAYRTTKTYVDHPYIFRDSFDAWIFCLVWGPSNI